jgi:transcriptional regulator with XRE-family HTH domain
VSVTQESQATFARLLLRRRVEAGMSQEELAHRTGLSVRAISDIERGFTARPRRSSVGLLARALGLDELSVPGAAAGHHHAIGDTSGQAVPRRPPTAVPDFVGRAAELAALTGLLDQADGRGGTVVTVAIRGTAGVGKTALAVRWAHQVADKFPDGQLYIDLRGFSPSGGPVAAADVLGGFLEALGVPPAKVPEPTEARVGLYRSLMAGKRMLVLLDNASDADHVRPLLPASHGCLVLVTSRGPLTGLAVTDGAYLIPLDVLSGTEAVELPASRLGGERVAAEPPAARTLAELTGGLPIALTVTAARLAAYPAYSIASTTAELRDARRPHVLDGGDPHIEART